VIYIDLLTVNIDLAQYDILYTTGTKLSSLPAAKFVQLKLHTHNHKQQQHNRINSIFKVKFVAPHVGKI